MTAPELRPYQLELVASARHAFAAGKRRVLLQAPTGPGKCLGRGTPVPLFDGVVVPVEVGDLLTGPDGEPREGGGHGVERPQPGRAAQTA